MYLARYHDVTISNVRCLAHSSQARPQPATGIATVQTHTDPVENATRNNAPGHQLQVDVKFIEPLGQTGKKKRYYQYTAIDDCTRLRVLRAYPRNDQKVAIQFIDHALSKLPFQVEKVQTDNGQEFGSAFYWHLLDMGIGHVKIRPRTPRVNGKVERSHRIDSDEFYRLLEGESHRRCEPVRRTPPTMGRPLQLRSTPRRPFGANTRTNDSSNQHETRLS